MKLYKQTRQAAACSNCRETFSGPLGEAHDCKPGAKQIWFGPVEPEKDAPEPAQGAIN